MVTIQGETVLEVEVAADNIEYLARACLLRNRPNPHW